MTAIVLDVVDINDGDSLSRSKSSSLPQHHAATMPGLIQIHSDCGACPFCTDVCEEPGCASCMVKTKVMNEKRLDLNRRRCRTEPPSPFRIFSSTKADEKDRVVTPCELRRHNTKDSAWLLCGEIIYDATDFIEGHPGGRKSILKKSGGAFDCSRDMGFHSPRAISLWKSKKIGILRPCPGECGIIQSENENGESCTIS